MTKLWMRNDSRGRQEFSYWGTIDSRQTDIRIHMNIDRVADFIVNGRNRYRADQKPDSKIPPNRLQLSRLSLVERAAVGRIRREITKKQKWNLSLDKKWSAAEIFFLAIKAAGSAQRLSNKEQCKGWQEVKTVRAGEDQQLHLCCASACCIYNRSRRPPASITYRNTILSFYQNS